MKDLIRYYIWIHNPKLHTWSDNNGKLNKYVQVGNFSGYFSLHQAIKYGNEHFGEKGFIILEAIAIEIPSTTEEELC